MDFPKGKEINWGGISEGQMEKYLIILDFPNEIENRVSGISEGQMEKYLIILDFPNKIENSKWNFRRSYGKILDNLEFSERNRNRVSEICKGQMGGYYSFSPYIGGFDMVCPRGQKFCNLKISSLKRCLNEVVERSPEYV